MAVLEPVEVFQNFEKQPQPVAAEHLFEAGGDPGRLVEIVGYDLPPGRGDPHGLAATVGIILFSRDQPLLS